MRRILLAMALACLGMPALANSPDKSSDTQKSPLASEDTKAKRAPPAKTGGLLNTDVTPEQAKRVAEETNRQIVRREKSKTPR